MQKKMADPLKYENNLEDSGWTRRFTACEPRLSETVELYKESGFEVLVVNLPSKKVVSNCKKNDEKFKCRKCFDGIGEKYRVIYTRPQNLTT